MIPSPLALHAKGLKKAFYHPKKIELFKDLDIEVAAGETVAIIGRSGEGKSTLLQILGTLDQPCSGDLKIEGVSITPFNRCLVRNAKLGFVFQSFHLLEDYTALDNVMMPAKIARERTSPRSPAHERACHLLSVVGLESRMHHNAKQLSGGEKQRVAIARALCNDPSIILADEPSGNLDGHTSAHIHELLLNFANQQKKTLIVVTHDLQLASLCQKRYRLSEGQLLSQE